MSMPAKKMQVPAKSAPMKLARDASVSTVSGGSARMKSAPSPRKDVQPPEWEDDEFDRAIAEALKAGLLDDMIADALQDKRDGKTMPL